MKMTQTRNGEVEDAVIVAADIIETTMCTICINDTFILQFFCYFIHLHIDRFGSQIHIGRNGEALV